MKKRIKKKILAIHIIVLIDLPIVGPILFQQNVLVYLGFLFVAAFYILFN